MSYKTQNFTKKPKTATKKTLTPQRKPKYKKDLFTQN